MDRELPPVPPTPPTNPDTVLKKADVRRTNAFLELDKVMAKIMEVNLAVGVMPVARIDDKTGKAGNFPLAVHVAPGQLSDVVRAFVLEHKRLAIAVECLCKFLEDAGALDKAKLLELEAEAAEKTTAIMQRGLLSQGASGVDPPPGAIIKGH